MIVLNKNKFFVLLLLTNTVINLVQAYEYPNENDFKKLKEMIYPVAAHTFNLSTQGMKPEILLVSKIKKWDSVVEDIKKFVDASVNAQLKFIVDNGNNCKPKDAKNIFYLNNGLIKLINKLNTSDIFDLIAFEVFLGSNSDALFQDIKDINLYIEKVKIEKNNKSDALSKDLLKHLVMV